MKGQPVLLLAACRTVKFDRLLGWAGTKRRPHSQMGGKIAGFNPLEEK